MRASGEPIGSRVYASLPASDTCVPFERQLCGNAIRAADVASGSLAVRQSRVLG